MSTARRDISHDARFLAQERIVDALLRSLALQQPQLLQTLRDILVDTEFTHSGKPEPSETVHQQIDRRIDAAGQFAQAHGTDQKTRP
jgi:hypothetical protein